MRSRVVCLLFAIATTSRLCFALPGTDDVAMEFTPSPPDLTAIFPEFKHVPFQDAGCSPFILPLQCEPDASDKQRSEADALAMLISFDLDWIPTNYSGRHASFIFQRREKAMIALKADYKVEEIKSFIAGWKATAAVGGTLEFSSSGIVARLQMFDRSGKVTWNKQYPPKDFFSLLGDVDADLMRQFGFEPPAALVTYLHQPRCARPESVAAFGATAHEPRDQMLKEIAALLQKDPGFGDVHGWWASQYAWTVGFDQAAQQQKVLALHDHLESNWLSDVDLTQKSDPDILAMYQKCIAQASDLAGGDSPAVVAAELNSVTGLRGDPADLVSRALPIAAQFPNSQVPYELARTLLNAGDVDARLAGSIAMMDAANNYDPGVGDRRNDRDLIARALEMLGRPDLQYAELTLADLPSTYHRADRLHALISMGRSQQVLDDLARSPLAVTPANVDSACLLVLAAALNGYDEQVTRLSDQWSALFEKQLFLPVIHFYLAARQGRLMTVDDLSLLSKLRGGDLFYSAICLMTLSDQMTHGKIMANVMLDDAIHIPADRRYWILIDRYIRTINYPHGPSFYSALSWLFPNDPWVKGAAADAARRAATQPAVQSADEILTFQRTQLDELETPVERKIRTSSSVNLALRGWLNPFIAASSVRHLMDAHDPAAARQLALRYRELVKCVYSGPQRAWAKLLLDKTEPSTFSN